LETDDFGEATGDIAPAVAAENAIAALVILDRFCDERQDVTTTPGVGGVFSGDLGLILGDESAKLNFSLPE